MKDKIQLLGEVDRVLSPIKKLDLNYYLFTILSIVFVALLAFPKIYIQQQIYFISRDIAKLKSEHDTLKEENKIIKHSVESIKFKNQILDTLF